VFGALAGSAIRRSIRSLRFFVLSIPGLGLGEMARVEAYTFVRYLTTYRTEIHSHNYSAEVRVTTQCPPGLVNENR